MTDDNIHDTDRYHFPDIAPEQSQVSGLDELGLRLPVTDRAGKAVVDTQILIGRLPVSIEHEGADTDEATVLDRGIISDEDERTQAELEDITRMVQRVEKPVVEHILNEYNDYLIRMIVDTLEASDPGEFHSIADVAIEGKRGEQWYCSDIVVEVREEPVGPTERDAEFFQ